jgi:hypothetical protein
VRNLGRHSRAWKLSDNQRNGACGTARHKLPPRVDSVCQTWRASSLSDHKRCESVSRLRGFDHVYRDVVGERCGGGGATSTTRFSTKWYKINNTGV